MLGQKLSTAALLLCYISIVAGHGGSSDGTMDMGGISSSTNSSDVEPLYLAQYKKDSYAGLNSYTGSILAHIVLEVVAWVFVLPIGMLPLYKITTVRLTLLKESCSAPPDRSSLCLHS